MAIPMQKGRLGRGLASLIGESPTAQPRLPAEGEQRIVPIDQLHPSASNPRKDFRDQELAELADSIRQKGLVQPIIARIDRARGGYEIVAGERRWRAAQRAGLHQVLVIVRDLSDQEVLEVAIIENVQRTDLNAIEEATGYNDLIERFGYTQEQLADVIGKSRSHLANTLRLLKLPPTVRVMVQEGKLTAGHARALVGRQDAEKLADHIVDHQLNVREVEALVQGGGRDAGGKSETRRRLEKDADTRAFEKDLSDALGLKVEIKPGSGESGLLTIKYGNYDQLDYLRARLVGSPSS
ncbi:MAG: ParB/RepB/Spo0J family partition protein [Hyphomicrobiaceae bacterium]|nr:MAG: ParB/RepB/Spo0J family partition protein [Hyphomicrobiaceae bacterium]